MYVKFFMFQNVPQTEKRIWTNEAVLHWKWWELFSS